LSVVYQSVIASAALPGLGSPSVQLQQLALGDGLWAFLPISARSDRPSLEALAGLALEISAAHGHALLLQYDDRSGFRSAALYRDGTLARVWSEADELWVPLDEEGEPMTSSQPLRTEELVQDGDQEYETIKDAIQLGLEAFGAPAWLTSRELRDRIVSAP
jgi:hypothetical protein